MRETAFRLLRDARPDKPVLALGALALAFALVFVSPASAETGLQLTNTDATALSLLGAEGLSGGQQVDDLGRTIGNLTLDGALSATYPAPDRAARATLEFDGGQDLFRFEGAAMCAGLVQVRWRDRQGAGLPVLGTQIVAARAGSAEEGPAWIVQAVSTVDASTSEETLAVAGGETHRIAVHFGLGADGMGRAASFTHVVERFVACDQVVEIEIGAAEATATRGSADVGPSPAGVTMPAASSGRDLLDSVVVIADAAAKSTTLDLDAFAGDLGERGSRSKSTAGGATSSCTVDDFSGPALDPVWTLSNLGDADQAAATIVGGRLQLTGDGTTLYHGTDNGGFLSQTVTGDFRAEVTLIDVPLDQGGDFRKFGMLVNETASDLAPRVMVQLVVDHPFYETTALQFDFRNKAGDALELASTPVDLSLPLKVAVDRRGDVFTAYFSTDGGASWTKPLGGVGQGSIEIAMGPTAEVGLSATSYDADLPMTVELDDFVLCRPNTDPAPTPPDVLGCQADQLKDLLFLVDASGSMTAAFPGAPSKLEAAADAIASTNAALGSNFPGSRAALVTYRASRFSDPAFNVAQGAQVLSPLTTDLAAVTAAAAAIDPATIHPDANTPAPIALDRTTQLLVDTADPSFQPIVIWLTDGAPNIDIDGRGPLEYRFSEILPLSIRDTGGDFLPWGQVAWLGNFNGGIATYDGEVFANTIYQIERLKASVPEAVIYPVAIRGEDTYYEDLMAYAAYYTGTQLFTVDDAKGLAAAIDQIAQTLDCGAAIGDRLWHDSNGDGVQDAGEAGIEGVTVELRNGSGTVVATTVTGTDGLYRFDNVVPGTYTVTVDASTLPAAFDLPTYDLDGVGTPNAASVTVAAGDERLDVDFGYRGSASIGDRVWLDENGDGVQDAGEPGIEGVAVVLRDGGGAVIGTATTGADGLYLFDSLAPGSYTVEVDPATLPADAAAPTYDFDGVATPNVASVTVGEGEDQLDVDFGYLALAECEEGVYRDDFDVPSFANQDGTLDWSDDWQEDDPSGPGVASGQVQVHDGFLTLDDYPDTGGEPGVVRTADLSRAERATLAFRFLTSGGVDHDDAVTVDVSSDGGATWTVLEVITGIDGSLTDERSFDLTGFASENTQVRFRVTNKYGGSNELFCLDWVEIRTSCESCVDIEVRDDFDHRSFSNNDGPDDWTAAWIEVDPLGAGPFSGAVQVESGGLATLNLAAKADQPSLAREINLKDAESATLSFAFITSSGVDATDAFYVEVSSDGGATWTLVDTVDGISGYAEVSKTYDLTAYASERTVVRVRIAQGSYQGHNEGVCFDWIEVVGLCDVANAPGSISGTVWNDLNGNGIQEDASTGLGGVKVKLVQNGTLIERVWTDSHGNYTFDNVPAGTYKVRVVASTVPASLTEATYDVDGVDTPNRAFVDVAAAQNLSEVDFGYRQPSSGGGGCSDCQHASGYLSGSGDSEIEPGGSYFWADSGRVEGWLDGPGSADFDLYLYRWNGYQWRKVGYAETNSSDEHVAYDGSAGYYTWKVRSWSGSGSYELRYDHP